MTYAPVPVLLWVDLPAAVQFDDSSRHVGLPIAPAHLRCHARVLGDQGQQRMRLVPKDGGYRCPMRATNAGLCYRHWDRADHAVRYRAQELAAVDSASVRSVGAATITDSGPTSRDPAGRAGA